jgi:hypothetical protein
MFLIIIFFKKIQERHEAHIPGTFWLGTIWKQVNGFYLFI